MTRVWRCFLQAWRRWQVCQGKERPIRWCLQAVRLDTNALTTAPLIRQCLWHPVSEGVNPNQTIDSMLTGTDEVPRFKQFHPGWREVLPLFARSSLYVTLLEGVDSTTCATGNDPPNRWSLPCTPFAGVLKPEAGVPLKWLNALSWLGRLEDSEVSGWLAGWLAEGADLSSSSATEFPFSREILVPPSSQTSLFRCTVHAASSRGSLCCWVCPVQKKG